MNPPLRLPRIAAICAALLALCSLVSVSAAPAQPPTVPRGAAYAVSADTGQRFAIPLESTEVVMDVKPGLMEVQVTQTFTNRTATALEATYLYPLPDRATVTQFELRYKDRIVRSEVREKTEAKAVYDAAKAAGKKTALLEQHDPSLFSTAVANFLPGERVEVIVHFVQPLMLTADAIEVRFPMVTGDKYFPAEATPGTAGNAAANPARRDESLLAANHVYAFDIQVAGIPVKKIASPSHSIRATPTGSAPERFTVSLEKEITIPDRDFVLRIETRSEATTQPTVVTQHTATGDYGLVTLFPPRTRPATSQTTAAPRPRDVLFLVDHSGSMAGPRMASARLGRTGCLEARTAADRVQIVIFDSGFVCVRPEWSAANPAAIADAHRYVGTIEARGGTELQRALRPCLDAFERNDRQQILILLTDGDVGNATSLFNLIEEKIGQVRLFTFGIGAAPNATLLKQMAELGRGQARFIGNDDGVAEELTDLFATLDAPVLARPELSLLDAQGTPIAHAMFPERLSDVFVGRPIQVVYRTTQGAPAAVAITGTEGDRPVSQRIALQSTVLRGDGLEKEFGRRLFADTGTLLRKAKTDDERTMIRKEMLATALQFQLVTELTSRVAVDDRVSRDPNAMLASEHVAQYGVADVAASGGGSARAVSGGGGGGGGGAYPVGVGADGVVFLHSFSVSSEREGYSTSTVSTNSRSRTATASTHLRSEVSRRILDDFPPSTVEAALVFALDPQTSLITDRPGSDATLLDGLPIATVVDPATIESITLQPSGPTRMEIAQQRPTRKSSTTLTGRFGSDDFTAFSVRSAFHPGGDHDGSVLGVVSWSRFDHPQSSVLLEGEKVLGETRTQFGGQWRDLSGYGDLRLVRGSIDHKFDNGLRLEAAAAWHELRRDDARQFRLASPTARYDGLGFLNLDLLTAETTRLADTVAQLQLSGRNRVFDAVQTWSARARWHRQESDWTVPRAGDPAAAVRDNRSLDLTHRIGPEGDRTHFETHFGITDHTTPHTTLVQRSTWTGSLGIDRRLTEAITVFANGSHESALPWLSTGRWQPSGTGSLAVAPETETRNGGQLGLRFEQKYQAWNGTIAAFHEDVAGHEYRDWAWERSHPSLLAGGKIRLPVSTTVARDFAREGWTGSLAFTPNRAFTTMARWSVDWKNQGPYRGGNERATLLAHQEIRSGWLRNAMAGVALHYRNALVFDDGYTLHGGLRTDAMVGYRLRPRTQRETLFQLNATNLAARSWQLTRFAPDRGRQLLFTVSQGF